MAKKAAVKSSKSHSSKAKPAAKPVPARAAKAARPAIPPAKAGKGRAVEAVAKKEEKVLILKTVFKASQLREYRAVLQKVRERVVDEIAFLAGDNLHRSPRESSGDLSSHSFHMADQGTDNFDREFALNLVSSEQDALYEIDDALRRIDLKTYGVCESCGKQVERARLKALPFAKMCIACKSSSEKGKSRFRPFGPTISQTAEG